MQRRDFIRLVGGGVVLAATGACASTGTDPRAAWSNPGAGESDPRRRALSWAILAPNPHNMQPWLADLSEPGVVSLYIDRERLLPVTDPFNRQIVIGCGAFLELLRMAAAKEGWLATTEPFPQGEPHPLLDERPVARVTLAKGGMADPLSAHTLARRTNRNAYEDRPVPMAAAQAIQQAAQNPLVTTGFTVEPARVEALKALAFEGADVEAHTPAAHRESVERTFIGAKAVAEHRYGILLDAPAIEAVHALGLLTREKMATPGTFAFDQSLAFLKKGADTARGFVWMSTVADTRAEQLAAGAAYLRANLAAAGLGLSMHPWSQCLQEYATQDAVRAKVHAALGAQGGRVQMFARIGYAKAIPATPRRGLAANLKDA